MARYLEQRMSVVSQADAMISELRVRHNTFGLALDLTGLMIPVERLSPVECVAIIQTLLAESECDPRLVRSPDFESPLGADPIGMRWPAAAPEYRISGMKTTDFGSDSTILVD
ncbi:hypothetical protein PHMEG_0005842 [Phytophthora megakarya]|uniref:Uncharacterized protein n=1 Tax=Phytophthora megakarya TaxID=4795 RepID=A0A225WRQ6_9STRA|nr:hypothetical protein PHMEG_0005842 [Phytophthora megakarya]